MNLAALGNKGPQPAVLLLLPFTSNDAALSQLEPMIPSGTPGDDRRTRDQLPLITSTFSKTKLRPHSPFSLTSSSSVVSLNSLASFKTRSHKTDVLHSDQSCPAEETSRGGRELNVGASKENAHARSHTSPHNLQSLTPTLRRHCNLDTMTSATHLLPKPIFEPAKHLWLPKSRSYFRNSLFGNINNGELNSYSVKRVKVHITDLPRSHTPISDNDPDKLNMKNVVAFLQSNSKIKVTDESSGHGVFKEEMVATSTATQRHSLKRIEYVVGEDNQTFLNQKQKTLKPNFHTTRRGNAVCKFENTPNLIEKSEPGLKTARTRNQVVSRESNLSDQENVQRVPARSQVHEEVISPNAYDNRPRVEYQLNVNNLPGPRNKPASDISQQIYTNVRIFPVHRYNLVPIVRPSVDYNSVDATSEPKNLLNVSQELAPQKTKLDISSEDLKQNKPSTPKGRRNSKIKNSSRFSSSSSNQPLASSEKAEGEHQHQGSSQSQQATTSVIFLPSVHPELESDDELPRIPQQGPAEQSDEQNSPAKINDKVNTASADRVNIATMPPIEAHDNQTKTASWKIPTHVVTTTETFDSVKTETTAQTSVYVDRKDQTCLSSLTSQSTFSDKNSSPTGNNIQISVSTSAIPDRQEKNLKSFQLDAHQRTFIRLVNQELASLRQTRGPREHASALLWTLSYQNPPDIVHETNNSESPREQVRLRLRKEREKTRAVTYLTDLEKVSRKQ